MNHLKIMLKTKRRSVGANLISLFLFCYGGKRGWSKLIWIPQKIDLPFGEISSGWLLKVEGWKGGWVPQQFEFQWKFLKHTFFKIYTDVWFMMLYDALWWLLLLNLSLKSMADGYDIISTPQKKTLQSYQQQLRGLSQCSTYRNTSRESFIPSVTFMVHEWFRWDW